MTDFFLGPMSKNVIDTVIKRCHESDCILTLIPSRRQVDYNGGYVSNTSDFVDYVRSKSDKVLIQRDHAGPGQGQQKDTGLISLRADCKLGFDLIHIDPWLQYPNFDDAVRLTYVLISDCIDANKDVRFEVGTEEAIRPYEADELDKFLITLKNKLGVINFERIDWATIQAGTRLQGTTNTGVFNEQRCKDMISVCKKHGLNSKEHNGDYLNPEDIQQRVQLGIDGINIAPELGVVESTTLLGVLSRADIEKFYQLCFESGKWRKWFPADFIPEQNKTDVIRATGHYVYTSDEFKELIDKYETHDVININLDQFVGRLCQL